MNDTGMIEFIDVYKQNRCLWDPSDVSYANRVVRKAAYNDLLNIFKKYDNNANLASVKRKIDSIRSTYLRELKKVQASEISGSDSNEKYVPSLWYYDLLNFLSDVQKVAKARTDSLEQYFFEDIEEERQDASHNPREDTIYFRTPLPKTLKRKRIEMSAEKFAVTPLTGPIDNWEAFGLSVGGDLRNLEIKQQTIAQKLISDVIFFSKMGRLSESSNLFEPSVCLLTSPSESGTLSPTPPPCNTSGSLSPSHDVAANLPQSTIIEDSKYSLSKDSESEKNNYFFKQKISANALSDILTNQQKPEQTS